MARATAVVVVDVEASSRVGEVVEVVVGTGTAAEESSALAALKARFLAFRDWVRFNPFPGGTGTWEVEVEGLEAEPFAGLVERGRGDASSESESESESELLESEDDDKSARGRFVDVAVEVEVEGVG